MREEMRSHEGLARLAETQYGVISYRQLREMGFSKGHIARAQQAARLRRIHLGVYAVGHAALSHHGRAMGAVLVFPQGAVVSHDSAAWLWGLTPTPPHTVEVTVAARGNRRPGLRVHRVWSLPEEEEAERERIPVTSVARTLVDLADVKSTRQLAAVVDRAKRRGKLDISAVDRALDRRHHGHGKRPLEGILRLYRRPVFDRARSELLLLDALHDLEVALPSLNLWVAGYEIDAYWERERFAVEVDGWETHGSRQAFENDRLRQEDLKLAGIDSVRITARRIEAEPKAVARRIKLLLSQRRRDLGL